LLAHVVDVQLGTLAHVVLQLRDVQFVLLLVLDVAVASARELHLALLVDVLVAGLLASCLARPFQDSKCA
jgi:hypothetical protein